MPLKTEVLNSYKISFNVSDTYTPDFYKARNYAKLDTIDDVNVEDVLSEYISNEKRYLEIENVDLAELVEGFVHIGVLFIEIDYEVSNKTLFDEIYKRNLYDIGIYNVLLMLRVKYGIGTEFDNDMKHKNYTLILSKPDSPLSKYVSNNIQKFISEIAIEICQGNIADDEDVVIQLLNNEDVELDTKKEYLEFLSTNIVDLTQVVDSNLWRAMMNKGIVVFSESNFVNYYIKFELDNALVNFLNGTSEINFTSVSAEFGDNM